MHDLFHGRQFAALLFDMDGTLTDSIAAANRVWTRWSVSHGLDPGKVLPIIHGVRAGDTIRGLNVPGMDVEKETEIVKQAEIDDVEGVVAIKGARAFLETLPPDRWAVVTSAPRALALRRFGAARLPVPRVLVSAEDVGRGKPAPDGFLLAARLLDVTADKCLVFEDTAAGVAAAEAAGAAVVVVNATHAKPIATRHPVIADYEGLDASGALGM
ncbi:MAG TPA: HAD-IA family hydrolase [Steroidobacteraceae bacterium]